MVQFEQLYDGGSQNETDHGRSRCYLGIRAGSEAADVDDFLRSPDETNERLQNRVSVDRQQQFCQERR